MAKSVPVTPLSGIGTNPSALDGLVPANPLINTIGGLVAAIFALRATPCAIAIRWPKAGDGTLRRVYLLGMEGYLSLNDLADTMEGDFGPPIVTLTAEDTSFSAKSFSQTDVSVTASLSGTALGSGGSLIRQIQDAVLMPSVPRLTVSQLCNKLDDLLLVNNEEPHVVLLSQFTQAVRIYENDAATQSALETMLAAADEGILSVASLDAYVPPSSGPDRHFWEPGAVIA